MKLEQFTSQEWNRLTLSEQRDVRYWHAQSVNPALVAHLISIVATPFLVAFLFYYYARNDLQMASITLVLVAATYLVAAVFYIRKKKAYATTWNDLVRLHKERIADEDAFGTEKCRR